MRASSLCKPHAMQCLQHVGAFKERWLHKRPQVISASDPSASECQDSTHQLVEVLLDKVCAQAVTSVPSQLLLIPLSVCHCQHMHRVCTSCPLFICWLCAPLPSGRQNTSVAMNLLYCRLRHCSTAQCNAFRSIQWMHISHPSRMQAENAHFRSRSDVCNPAVTPTSVICGFER